MDKDASGLNRRWSFGDGQTSTEAAPRHRYAQPGRYEVVLDIVNEAGASRSARAEVLVGRFSMVEGLNCSGAQGTGWCLQWPREARYNDVLIQKAAIGWGVGQDGQLYRTDETDPTWQRVDMGLPLRRLYDVKFADEQTGWALGVADDPPNHTGSRGVLLAKTIDGGRTWARHALPDGWTQADVESADLHVLDRQRVRARTSSTAPNLVSSDGGARWELAKFKDMLFATTGTAAWVRTLNVAMAPGFIRSTDLGVSVREDVAFMYPPTGGVGNLQFLDDRNGFATLETRSGSGLPSDAVWTTSNGGFNWSPVAPPRARHPLQTFPPTMTMLDPRHGYWSLSWFNLGLAGGVDVSTTTDGGATWGNGFFLGRQACATHGPMAGLEVWRTVGGCNADDPGNAFIELSPDLGATWRRVAVPLNVRADGLRSVDRDTDRALLVRFTTQSFRSTDDGKSWQRVKTWPVAAPLPRDDSPNSIAFMSSTLGAAVVAGGATLTTDDGGKTWRPGAITPLTSLTSGTRAERRGRWQVVDGESWVLGAGRLWNAPALDAPWGEARLSPSSGQPAGSSLRDMHFVDAQQGFAVGTAGLAGSSLWSTSDGGRTPWRRDAIDGLKALALRFADRQRGLVVGEAGAMAQTTDGGRTWSRRNSGSTANLHALHYASANVAVAVGAGGTVLISRDGGDTWLPVPLDSPFDWHRVHFADARTGWIVGDFGSIAHTRDGGETWQLQRTGTAEHLVDVFAQDAGTAWVMSNRGMIFTTASGGR